MNESLPAEALLEQSDGKTVSIRGVCSLGRSSSNTLVLKDQKASRRHAIIQTQNSGEYWLVDFGSTNGTMLNSRRVVRPTLLNDGDKILIGEQRLVFRKGTATVSLANAQRTVATERAIRNLPCWLLVVDIVDSTRWMQSCPAAELPVILGRWFSDCKQVVDDCEGQINKFLGDGFFAYWDDSSNMKQVAIALGEFCKMQPKASPDFRWVLHYGEVSMGGAMSMGEESLVGAEVTFAFRMEKLGGKLQLRRLVSAAARERLILEADWKALEAQEVGGYPGRHQFYTF